MLLLLAYLLIQLAFCVSSDTVLSSSLLSKLSPALKLSSEDDTAMNTTVQVRFFTRDEWLMKEYLTYLCAPEECYNLTEKDFLKNSCLFKDLILKQTIDECLEANGGICNETNEINTINCIMENFRSTSSLQIPNAIQECIDNIITMRIWKCMRRAHVLRLDHILGKINGKSNRDNATKLTAKN